MGNMSRDVVRMPTSQSDLTKTKWTEGKCFVTMGKYKHGRGQSCLATMNITGRLKKINPITIDEIKDPLCLMRIGSVTIVFSEKYSAGNISHI